MNEKTKSKHRAFTLAEVLITLGIVGVIAGMTIPNMVHKFQSKALEVQFQKSVSTIYKTLDYMKLDMGIDDLNSYCATSTTWNNAYGYYPHSAECYEYFYKYYAQKGNQVAGGIGAKNRLKNVTRNLNDMKTYNNNPVSIYNFDAAIQYTNSMPDGSFVAMYINSGRIMIGIDVNGYKKPNKYGHDIFLFSLSRDGASKLIGYRNDVVDNESAYRAACSLTSTSKINGAGCTDYALRNECPYDNTKKYFECLPK